MSSPFAIAAVTAVLADLLNDALTKHDLDATVGNFAVSAKPPGAIKIDTNEAAQLNLFMYMVTPNAAWRNTNLPAYDARGDRLSNPPLALDLHYMLTAYGQNDFQADVLLGYAMHILHERPILTRAMIQTALAPAEGAAESAETRIRQKLRDAHLGRLESIKVTPEFLSTEELSKLWSAFQTQYRPSVAYQASVVLIEADEPVRRPLPVLARGVRAQPATTPPLPPFATLTALQPPNQQPGVRMGETLIMHGQHLDGESIEVQFTNARHGLRTTLSTSRVAADWLHVALPEADQPHGALPDMDDDLIAGFYTVRATVSRTDQPAQTTNELPVVLAPRVLSATVRQDATLTVECTPPVRPEQRVSLLLGDREIVPEARSETPTSTLTFQGKDIPPGEYLVRLRVDGVDSLLVDRTTTPPTFDAKQKVNIP